MKIAIVGSRNYPRPEDIIQYVYNLSEDSIIISGGARGVDTWAEVAAGVKGLKTKIFPAQWDKYGKSAGFFRNELIVDECDRLVAFWDGKSKGTKHSINLVKKAGKPVEIIICETS